MSKAEKITDKEIDELYRRLKQEAESGGYYLNPDTDFTRALVKSLIKNQKRYGYRACPCRLASGKRKKDMDIICPCDYRDPDLDEYGTCYCALYVTKEVLEGRKEAGPIPERRNMERKNKVKEEKIEAKIHNIKYPVWRCRVCGYLCARENPPEICPICKAARERFEIFIEKGK